MQRQNIRHYVVANLFVFILTFMLGCAIDEGNLMDHVPTGRSINVIELPESVMDQEERDRLPEGTKIQKCNDGMIYRFDYPDGTIWLRNSAGVSVGGII
jgi:hypothetical protein